MRARRKGATHIPYADWRKVPTFPPDQQCGGGSLQALKVILEKDSEGDSPLKVVRDLFTAIACGLIGQPSRF